ncbi:MAG: CPBP family intramembrane glutamic endopeptidase [Cyanobacteria bacterium P01_G01_bin.39]
MFLSEPFPMLSASWFKVLAFFGLWSAIWLPIALLISRLIDWQPKEPLTLKQKLILLSSLYILVPAILAWKIKVESLSLASIGLSPVSNLLRDQLLGLMLSLVSLGIIFSLEFAFGLIDWHWHHLKKILPLILPIFCLSLIISLIEELVFRGYVFITLIADNSWWFAAIASSFIFAMLHLIWERKQTVAQLPGLFLMGIVLVMARTLAHDSLYLAIGLHAGWIWGLTCIDSAELITYRHQNHWMTGINQQPLAGFAGLLCLGITGLTLFGLFSSHLWSVIN